MARRPMNKKKDQLARRPRKKNQLARRPRKNSAGAQANEKRINWRAGQGFMRVRAGNKQTSNSASQFKTGGAQAMARRPP